MSDSPSMETSIALLVREMQGLRADVSALQGDMERVEQLLARARGAAWAISGLAGLVILLIGAGDRIKAAIRGWLA